MSKHRNQNRKPQNVKNGDMVQRPNILVLEALSGSGSAIREAGGIPISVSPTDPGRVAETLEFETIHAVLFTGGGDVNPRLYRRRPHKKVYGVNDTRDIVECSVLEIARERGLPILGICRGAQIQNVEAGGTMRQHIGGHYGEHPVIVTPGTTLAAATVTWANKAQDRLEIRDPVVSLHHQEIGKVARGYRVTGRAPDGTIEAIESTDGRCLGVQFHPEMDTEFAYARAFFRWLVVNACERFNIPIPPLEPHRPKYVNAFSKYGTGLKAIETKTGENEYTYRDAPATVKVSYFCSHCGMTFDQQIDYHDHMWLLHAEPVPGTPEYWSVAGMEMSDYEEWA